MFFWPHDFFLPRRRLIVHRVRRGGWLTLIERAAAQCPCDNVVVLAGGNTKFPGTVARLQRELPRTSIIAPSASAPHPAWSGACRRTHMPATAGVIISIDHYNQDGPVDCWKRWLNQRHP